MSHNIVKYLIFFFLLTLQFGLSGQPKIDSLISQKYSIHNEVFGTGLFLSSGIERSIIQIHRSSFVGKIGASICPLKKNFFYGLLLEFNFLTGSKNTYLEIGSGINYIQSTKGSLNHVETASSLFFIPRIGIRYVTKRQGYIIRFGVTPPFHLIIDKTADFTPSFIPFIGFSFGMPIFITKKIDFVSPARVLHTEN